MTVRTPVSVSQRIDHTLPICVGMASRASLAAAAGLAAERGRPAVVIASRRQVTDSTTPGYVGWTTLQWRARAGRTGLIAARDHGGPYQHPGDANRDPAAAMVAARQALFDDIDAGLTLLHVDTSLDAGGRPTDPEAALTRCVELVGACAAYAAAAGRDVAYEVGLEVQAAHVATARECREWTGTLLGELRRSCGVTPVFLVTQTGTHVVDGRNRGDLHRDRAGTAGRALRELAAMVTALGCRLKAHNCDFLGGEAINLLRACGVWANISPELGAAQTAAVLNTARQAGMAAAADRFATAVLAAGHWRKWVTPGGPAGEWDRIVLGGAYLFGTSHFAELAAEVDPVLRTRGTSLHTIAVEAGVAVVRRYG